jgi:hypothetical protein
MVNLYGPAAGNGGYRQGTLNVLVDSSSTRQQVSKLGGAVLASSNREAWVFFYHWKQMPLADARMWAGECHPPVPA